MTITKHTISFAAAMLSLALVQSTAAQSVFPTGTTIYDPAEAHSSYILISDHSAIGNHSSAEFRAQGGQGSPSDIRLIDISPDLEPVQIDDGDERG